MTQDKVGELVGVSLQQIQKYEIGANRVSASRLYELAQIFGKPISSFFEGYVRDEDFHNIEFKSEEELQKSEAEKSDEIKKLRSAFERIDSFEMRENIISFVESIAEFAQKKKFINRT
ncbi:MAG: transcriptional regulator, family [Rickettsiaceae bacterium]|nr:transcriptional regulator, family [Rickettsiaceae bacterium]